MMQPGRFTELFFLDEATAFAAGHRPCAMCRHEDYAMFLARWRELHPGTRGADELDDRLHRERFDQATGTQRRYLASSDDLPDGATVAMRGDAYVIAHEQGRRWTPNGYVGQARTLDRRVEVLTPPSVIAILRDGWDGAVPLIHPSGRA